VDDEEPTTKEKTAMQAVQSLAKFQDTTFECSNETPIKNKKRDMIIQQCKLYNAQLTTHPLNKCKRGR